MAEKIPLEAVVSSNIAAAGYDAERQVLAIQFKTNKAVRHYHGVGQELATAFYLAESKGKVYAGRIRGKFRAERVTGPCRNCKAEGYVGDVCSRCGTDRHFGVAPASAGEPR